MPVIYDHEVGFVIVDPSRCDECEAVDQIDETGCDAPRCRGYVCQNCGAGCDIQIDPENGDCAQALEAETDDEYAERINAERAAWGLSPLR